MKNNEESKYINIKFASHGFLNSSDEEIIFETYKAINDFILYRFLHAGDSKEVTTWLLQKAFHLEEGVASEYVKNFYFRFFTQQFKRSAMPDGPKIFSVSLSKAGYNIPSDISRR